MLRKPTARVVRLGGGLLVAVSTRWYIPTLVLRIADDTGCLQRPPRPKVRLKVVATVDSETDLRSECLPPSLMAPLAKSHAERAPDTTEDLRRLRSREREGKVT